MVSDHVYVNDALKCSTISITNSQNNDSKYPNEVKLMEKNKIDSTSGNMKKLFLLAKNKCKRRLTKKILYKRLPILTWLPKYSSDDAIGDIVAGLTVGLTVIPQALAYASIAGLPAAYGLYGSFFGCFIYIFLGSCKDVPVGPSAIVALMTFNNAGGSWQKSVLLCFLCGLVELAMGLLGLGFLIDFVSDPVSSGFTSAVSLIILTSQVKGILGIDAKGTSFIEIWKHIFKNIGQTKPADTTLGISCIIILFIMKKIATLKIGPEEAEMQTRKHKIINKLFWVLGTARNAVLVLLCGVIGYVFHSSIYGAPFRLIGQVPPGLPNLQLPPFYIYANESFIGKNESFLDIVSQMSTGLIMVPLISLMETISICKAFANGKSIDATQELIALGAANIANSFVQGFPGTGALSRGAVNHASGVKTQMGNIYTGSVVILALIFFTPYFYFIPKSTLSAIIIAAVIFMVEIKVIKPMWRSKKSDLIPGIGTFLACLVMPLEIGIFCGVGLNILFILYYAARPKVSVQILETSKNVSYVMITPDRCLIFPSVDYVRNLVMKQSISKNLPVVLDCTHIYGADYTAATAISALLQDFENRGQVLIFYNLKPSVSHVFEGISHKDFTIYYNEDQLDDLITDKKIIESSIL
ncbi:sodium-independent sulfate anion transporter [Condylostylus longicornis]|uniref:sodium-independent sulfate anion transporter n=1 Tax=Condylostylus longicornis TaxID=2530218 RepID=UPI00244E13C9|nr:sodium-independent sulfate anion transporter [Condylostylus longicornis]